MKTIDQKTISSLDNSLIKHSGIITKINDKSIFIRLIDTVNCTACQAKSACGVSDDNSKDIEVFDTKNSYSLYEEVRVVMGKSLGLKAVFYAYIFPFILLFTLLIVGLRFFKEWQAGLIALFALLPYYSIIFLLNTYFQKKFKITIEKQ